MNKDYDRFDSPSRRTVLQGAAVAALAPAGSASAAYGGSPLDVAIIGAGGAGISAGAVCRVTQAKYQIFEARNRIGGRCYSDNSFACPVDIGAEWFQFVTINPGKFLATNNQLFDLAVGNGWPVQPDLFDRAFYRNGQPVTDLFDPALLEMSAGYIQALQLINGTGAAAQAGKARDVSALAAMQPVASNPYFNLVQGALENQHGDPLDKISAFDLYLTAQLATDVSLPSIDNWKTPAGLGNFLASLTGALPIRKNTEITHIAWNQPGGVQLTLAGGGTVTARTVIVTVPIGVLQNNGITFDPPLPADHAAAIAGLRMASVAKIGMQFSTNIFGNATTSTLATWLNNDIIARVVEGRLWDQNIAVCIFGGPEAEKIEKTSGAPGLIKFALDAVEKVFGGSPRSALVHAKSSTWVTDRFSYGAYSSATPGHVPLRQKLAKPISNQIWFAGEAVAFQKHSSLAGAWDTGQSAAISALKTLGIPIPT